MGNIRIKDEQLMMELRLEKANRRLSSMEELVRVLLLRPAAPVRHENVVAAEANASGDLTKKQVTAGKWVKANSPRFRVGGVDVVPATKTYRVEHSPTCKCAMCR